jgi:hypothetical protein
MLGRKIPSFPQFRTMQGRPLYNEPTHSRRQLARDNRKAVNRDKGSLVSVANMEMGRSMVIIVEHDD